MGRWEKRSSILVKDSIKVNCIIRVDTGSELHTTDKKKKRVENTYLSADTYLASKYGMNKELLSKLKHVKEAYKIWKQGRVTQKKYRDGI